LPTLPAPPVLSAHPSGSQGRWTRPDLTRREETTARPSAVCTYVAMV
jgi:hypothetical protein